jgi:hypothetical protein
MIRHKCRDPLRLKEARHFSPKRFDCMDSVDNRSFFQRGRIADHEVSNRLK